MNAADKPVSAGLDTRGRVIAFLEFISIPDQVTALERVSAAEKVAQALSELWFEQIYSPSLNYVDALRGDLGASAGESFRAVFEEDEFDALERFHRFFELRLERLPKREDGASGLAGSAEWRHIQKDAANTLYFLEAGEEGRGDRLRWTLLALRTLLGFEPARIDAE